jgi:hypothetical protein
MAVIFDSGFWHTQAKVDLSEFLFIPGEVPSAKRGKRIILNRKTKKLQIINSKYTMDYLKRVKSFFCELDNKKKFDELKENLNYPLKIAFLFARKTKRSFDYCNIAQIVLDCMTCKAFYPRKKNSDKEKKQIERKKYAWIEDDDVNHVIPFFLGYFVDPKNPGVYITIFKDENQKI